MDFDWLVSRAKLKNLQNRLGFCESLARQVSRDDALLTPEQELADSKLTKEDTFCRDLNEPERRGLQAHRSEQAHELNLLSDLRPDTLRYAGA